LPEGYSIRLMEPRDYAGIASITAAVYTTERPSTDEELTTHHAVFPEGQFVVVHDATQEVAGAHFTLILRLADFCVDDSWDVVTAQGLFTDHDPIAGHTLYGADLMVHPGHQHHGLGRADARRTKAHEREEPLAHGRREPHAVLRPSSRRDVSRGLRPRVAAGKLVDPVLTVHLHDGWEIVTTIRGYLPHDVESAGWAAVIQWLNPDAPTPPEFDIRKFARRAPPKG
jgi:hypothetical protein